MKKIIVYIIACLTFTGCSDPSVQESANANVYSSGADTNRTGSFIIIQGSTTMAPILKSIAAYFQHGNKTTVHIEETGSINGLKSIFNDSADIAMSSHEISDSLHLLFKKGKQEYAEFLLAGDALVFIVNINNPVKKLTEEQLKLIFNGEVKSWQSVGGPDETIKILSRDQTSGTYYFLKEKMLIKKGLPNATEYLRDHKEIMRHVAKEKNAIGYISFSNLDYSVDPLSISFNGGKNYIQPRIETVNNLKYKYFRGLYLYYKPEAYLKIKPFMETVKSDTIQKIIMNMGYIPLSHRLIANH